MNVSSNIIRHYLKNVYFIIGTAYAGKSTMVKLLAEKHDMIFCGENYHDAPAGELKNPVDQPGLCYFETMSGWQEFINRPPEEYYRWICQTADEAAQIEVAELIRLSAQGKRIIVDTNISPELLRKISDYDRVAVMLSPQSMSVDRFFDRDDPEKQFLLGKIQEADDPEKTMANFHACIARCNSPEEYERFRDSGFFTLVRGTDGGDTSQEVLAALERHFKLDAGEAVC